MDAKCFSVQVIKAHDGRTFYKVWFNLTSGVGWLMTENPTKPGDVVQLEVYPVNSQDVKTNMRLGLRIV